jgi:diguanylate cyclase (GGDEF)-like protein/PAS domain S-box-containing protein
MPQIIIERLEGSLADRFRRHKVIIDGQVRGSIRALEKWAFEVAAGTHTVSFQVDFYHSPPTKVLVVNRTRLVCRSSVAHAFGLTAVFSPGAWISVHEEDDVRTVETPYPGDLVDVSNARAQTPKSSSTSLGLPASAMKSPGALRLFGPKMDQATQGQRLLELDLREAIIARKLELHYLPQIDLTTGRITTFEALLFWHHPVHGRVPAAHFVPLAEHLGFICMVGQNVLNEACREAASWPSDVSVSVKVTAAQLVDRAFPGIVGTSLRESNLPPSRLMLEVTHAVVTAGGTISTVLHALRASGVRIAIDDFGALTPPAANLPDAPFDEIKIHRSLITGIAKSRDRLAVVRTVLGSCAERAIPCCAIGVESKDDLEILRGEKCPQVQGHLFGTGLAARDVAGFLARWNPLAFGATVANQSGPIPFHRVLELANEVVMIATAELGPSGPTIVYVNQAFSWATGYSAAELVGTRTEKLRGAGTSPATLEAIRTAFQTGHAVTERIIGPAKNGTPYTLDVQIAPLTDDSGTITHFAMVGREVTMEKHLGEGLPEDDRDAMTGCANRQAMMRDLGALISEAQARADAGDGPPGPCLALIDIDDFARIAGNMGRAAADAVVCGMADRLAENIRRCDLFGRLGDDQFVVCMRSISLRDGETLARCLRNAVVDAPFETPCGPVHVRIGIGVAAFAPGDSLAMLLERTSNAFGAAKLTGREHARIRPLAQN